MVVFHTGVGWLPGGFVGVDVFYVISGFLITDHLWRELRESGRLSLVEFYARRARRLLPAAIVVLVATMAMAAAVLPPLEVRSVWKDGLYCALYVGNFRFAATGDDYLAGSNPSPFQHFWSLGVEEQFYLVWPLVLLAAALVWWRSRPSRVGAITAIAALSAASLYASVELTRANQPLAFFLLPARAWELGLGALVALAAPELRLLPHAVRAAAGWAGLAAVAVACVAFGAHTAFPGTAALLPVTGAAAVILAGLGRSPGGPGSLLAQPVMRGVGRVSYSWYLWHYPVLILVPEALGRTALPGWAMLMLALASLLPAALTFRFIETPGRQWRWLQVDRRRTLLAGLSLSGAGVIACLGAAVTIPSLNGHGLAPVARIQSVLPSDPAVTAPPGRSTTTVPPAEAALSAAQAQVETAVRQSAGTVDVPGNLNPPLSSASASEAAPMVDGCLLSYTATSVPDCLFGDTTATRSIVLFGDSHAAMWFPSVDAYANAQGYRLYVWAKAACPPVRITLFSPVLDRTWTECSEWYGNVLARIASVRPSLVVLGIAPNYDAAYDVVQNGPQWLAGLQATVTASRAAGSRVLVMGSAPSPLEDEADCLSEHLEDVPACAFSPVGRRVGGGGLVGIDQSGDAAEARTATTAGAIYADVDPWFCTATVCDVVVDDLLVYRDNSHITVPYADYLAPLVGDEMTVALSG